MRLHDHDIIRNLPAIETSGTEDGMEVTTLKGPTKTLKIRFNKANSSFTDFIVLNDRSKSTTKIAGEITALYSAAKKVMEKIACEKNKTITWIHSTKNKNIAAWAHTKGKELFQFTQTEGPSIEEIETKQFDDPKNPGDLKIYVKFERQFKPQ